MVELWWDLLRLTWYRDSEHASILMIDAVHLLSLDDCTMLRDYLVAWVEQMESRNDERQASDNP